MGKQEVHSVTGAPRGLAEQQGDRTRRYLISMAIRTICVLATLFVPGILKWVCIAGAVILPYVAVVIANAGRENRKPGPDTVDAIPVQQITSAKVIMPTQVFQAPQD